MQSEATVRFAGCETLGDCTRPEWILPQLRQHDTAGIIHELSQVLLQSGGIPDLLPFYQAALNQELMTPSVLGCGIAFPHARVAGLNRVQLALGRTLRPVPWGSRNAFPVQFIFLMAVPATESTRYLQILASLARLGQRPDALDLLRTASSAEAMHQVLLATTLRPGSQ